MKKFLLASLMAVFTLGLMSSCSKEDDGPQIDPTDYAEKIAGIYKGNMSVALGAGQPGAPTTEKIYVTRTGDNKVTMEIKNFSYEGMNLGDIKIEDITTAATKAVAAASKCAVAGSGKVTINLNGVPITADVTVSGTVAGDKADIKIVVDAAGLKVNVGFNGAKIGTDTPDYALEIAGTYTGKLVIPDSDPIKQSVIFVRQNENVARMSIKDFKFGALSLGDIVLDGVGVTKANDTYTVAGEGEVTVRLNNNPLKVTVKVDGTVKDKATELALAVTIPGLGKLDITFTGAMEYVPNTEAKLLSIEFEDNAKVAVQPSTADGQNYTFAMAADATVNDLKALVPTIKVSTFATVAPESGKAVDFSNGAVNFVVTAEDGTTKATYTVSCGGKLTAFYDFEIWEPYAPYGEDIPGAFVPAVNTGWATTNMAGAVLQGGANTPPYWPISSVEDGFKGKSARIYSSDARAMNGGDAEGMVPALVAGSLFQGKFELDWMSTLNSTKFGNICTTKPLIVEGYYQYTPGDSVITNEGKHVVDAPKDECIISAVLYEVANETETLTGLNLLTDPSIVAKGQFISGTQKDFKKFEVKLEYVDGKEYTPSKMYKFAIVCSSSKNGDAYKGPAGTILGAFGSMLVVDEMSVYSAF